MALTNTLSELINILSIIGKYKAQAFSGGLLVGPTTDLFLSLSKNHMYSKTKTDSMSWKLKMFQTFLFLRRFTKRYRQLQRFKL